MNKILTIKRREMKRNLKTWSELWWQLSKQEIYFCNEIWGLLCSIVVNVSYSLNRIVANLCLLFSNPRKGRLYLPCRLFGQSVGVSINSTLPPLKIKSSCDYSKVPPAPAQPAQHNGKVDILSPAAMENAYYICHNVQVGKHWAHARIPSDWLKG